MGLTYVQRTAKGPGTSDRDPADAIYLFALFVVAVVSVSTSNFASSGIVTPSAFTIWSGVTFVP
jgi:hypothetical protein